MCGICGVFRYQSSAGLDLDALRQIRDTMAKRGPDGRGEWQSTDGRVWLGHRRLAIIDLSERGAQPMQSEDGNVVVTFNGEIYNYEALRKDLEDQGCSFRSTSDTEVLIQLYRRKGPNFVSELRGMFAFALWDEDRAQMLLARDPYGIKPLYYSDTRGCISFASSVKALMTDPARSRAADPAGVAGFFLFGSVPEPFTIFECVRALPAGTVVTIDKNGSYEPRRYHSIPSVISEAEAYSPPAGADRAEAMRVALLDSVRHHLVADVPVGAFLSAGVDSGALVGLMLDAGAREIRTVTLAYDDFANQAADEAPLAARVARHYGTVHTTRRVTAQEFHADLPAILGAMDQPTIDGINTWFVSKAARELGLKIAVSGVGGDELLGGYSTFENVPKIAKWLAFATQGRLLARALEFGVSAVRSVGVDLHPKLSGLLRYGGSLPGAYFLQRSVFLPSELRGIFSDPEFLRVGLDRLRPLELIANVLSSGPRTAFGQVAALESCFYLRNQLLRDADWAGMAHSLEIRTPLVDHELLRRVTMFMANSGRQDGKTLLAMAPRNPLPPEVVSRHKTGFGIPIEAWFTAMTASHETTVRERPWSRTWARQVAQFQQLAL
jgi:asparagine synthase (glutamine-hydrolysing)